MPWERTARLERAFWHWRLQASRVAALVPSSILTGAGALVVLLADLAVTGGPRPRAPERAARAWTRPAA
jgi:hypothetical protein